MGESHCGHAGAGPSEASWVSVGGGRSGEAVEIGIAGAGPVDFAAGAAGRGAGVVEAGGVVTGFGVIGFGVGVFGAEVMISCALCRSRGRVSSSRERSTVLNGGGVSTRFLIPARIASASDPLRSIVSIMSEAV